MGIKELNEIISSLEKLVYGKNKIVSKADIKLVTKAQEILVKANKAYYLESEEVMSDFMYDRLKKLVLQVEELHPELKSNIGDIIGAGVVLGTKVKHSVPMLSLSNTYNEEELNDWVIKSSATGDKDIIIESKLDGCSISLIYKKGKLVQALSRGDGITGEDITANVMQIRTIPKEIDCKDDITIRGEILMSYKSFTDNNAKLVKSGQAPFANPRNAASGTLRHKDYKVVADRNLDAMMYQIINPTKYNLNTEEDVLKYLSKLGFRVPYHFYAKFGTYKDFLLNDSVSKDKKEFPCDGLVFKLNNFADQFRLGVTNKAPRYAVAYKFPPKEATTILKSVSFQVGRSGKITPVANFEPVVLDGTVVEHATLHNITFLMESGLRINDKIGVVKAAEIIPQITGYDKNYRSNAKEFTIFPIDIPNKCPSCGTDLDLVGKELVCKNPDCFDKKLAEYEHFISRDGVNINGIGTSLISDAMNSNFIKSFPDIFKLKSKTHVIIAWEGYSDKTVENIVNAIDKAIENITFADLIGSVGIPQVGKVSAKKLVSGIQSFDLLLETCEKYPENIKGILGDVAGTSVIEYFSNKDNVNMFREFEKIGIKLYKTANKSKLAGMKVCITGSYPDISRDEMAKELDERYGIVVTNSVSSNVSYLVIGDKPTQHKIEKAESLGIRVLNYNTLLVELEKENVS